MDPHELHRAMRAAWNDGAVRSQGPVARDIAFLRAGGRHLLAPELRILHDTDSLCRRAIHLRCPGGRRAVRAATDSLEAGAPVRLRVNMGRVHMIEPSSERSLLWER